ncbi:MAG TPA: serine protease, partial [Pyrinomonadaceae bacterium]|nr:serine protease [Pyrinomonadaceae bacterium]
ERSISLGLEFTRQGKDSLDRGLTVLFGVDPNGYATGFLVKENLVITAYHVVSGELSDSKKMNLKFNRDDKLNVRIYVNGCRATVLKVDKEADLALLEICGSTKNAPALVFQSDLVKDENLLLVARPRGNKLVSKGVFHGSYPFRGMEYWSAKITSRDGYSGSPVYNNKAELVGVFTGYDQIQEVALISPASRAQKLLEDYLATTTKP